MSDFPTLALQTTITGLVTRRAGSGAAVAAGAIPLQQGRVTTASLAARTQQVWVNTGAGLVEQAVYVAGIGRYPDGSYRALYVEMNPGVSIPVYPMPALYDASRHNSLPTAPTAGLAAEIRFGTVRGTTDVAQTWCTTEDGFVDGTTKLPPGGATNAATSWMWHPDVMGSPPAVIAATDRDYLSKCGVFGVLATRQEAEAITDLLESGITVGARATADHARFDYYLRDLWWGDAAASNNNAFTQNTLGNTTGANWTGLDLSNSAPGLVYDFAGTGNPTNTAFTGTWTVSSYDASVTVPPGYFAWRYAAGMQVASGGHNYYDYAKIMYVEYARTGDLAYLFRAHATAWGYAYAMEHADFSASGSTTSRNVRGPNWINVFLHQPAGLGYHHLLTGDPLSRRVLDAVATLYAGDPYFAQSSLRVNSTTNGEPRPVARALEATRQLLLGTRPTSDGFTALQGGESRDWATEVANKVAQINTGTMIHNPLVSDDLVGLDAKGPAPGWTDGRMASYGSPIFSNNNATGNPALNNTVAKVGFNNFMMPMVLDVLTSIYDDGFVGSSTKTAMLATVKLTADFLFPGTFEGSPQDNTHATISRSGNPSFKQGFSGAADPITYTPDAVALMGMYPAPYAWLALRLDSIAYKAIALRLLDSTAKTTTQTVSLSNVAWTDPYLIDSPAGGGPWKGTKEWMTFLPRVYEPIRLVAGGGAIPSDVAAEVRIYANTTTLFLAGDVVGTNTLTAPASTTSYQVRSRTADQTLGGGRVVLPNRTYSVTSTDPTKATGVVVGSTLTVTRLSAGAATITVTDVTPAPTGFAWLLARFNRAQRY